MINTGSDILYSNSCTDAMREVTWAEGMTTVLIMPYLPMYFLPVSFRQFNHLKLFVANEVQMLEITIFKRPGWPNNWTEKTEKYNGRKMRKGSIDGTLSSAQL